MCAFLFGLRRSAASVYSIYLSAPYFHARSNLSLYHRPSTIIIWLCCLGLLVSVYLYCVVDDDDGDGDWWWYIVRDTALCVIRSMHQKESQEIETQFIRPRSAPMMCWPNWPAGAHSNHQPLAMDLDWAGYCWLSCGVAQSDLKSFFLRYGASKTSSQYIQYF